MQHPLSFYSSVGHQHSKDCHQFLVTNITVTEFLSKLTIRNTAARRVNLHLTSRSIGKVIPKLSASVNNSFAGPDHCFVTFPTSSPSFVKTYKVDINICVHFLLFFDKVSGTWKLQSLTSKSISLQQQEKTQTGPFNSKSTFLSASHI